jgi:hypothetical protein
MAICYTSGQGRDLGKLMKRNLGVLVLENCRNFFFYRHLRAMHAGFKRHSFYLFKIIIEILSLFLVKLGMFFLRKRFKKLVGSKLFLVLIGKYIPNISILNFDYFHLDYDLKKRFQYNHSDENFVELYFENHSLRNLLKRNYLLFSSCQIIVLVSSWNPYAQSISHPSKFYFYLAHWLSREFKLIIIGWDSVSDGFWKKHVINQKWVEVKVTENPNLIGLKSIATNQCDVQSILMPINLSKFPLKTTAARPYDVFFSGKMNSYRDYRMPYIDLIKGMDFNSFIHETKNPEDFLSYEQLYEIMGHSKIGVNFSKSVDQKDQLKGRVWEILLSGALLLEQENSQITNYFAPNLHFVFFTTPMDLARKVSFYLNNRSDRCKIASTGRSKALSLQNELRP